MASTSRLAAAISGIFLRSRLIVRLGDFRDATWCFIYIEGDAGIGGNIGFMFMVNTWATLFGTLAAPVSGGASLVPVLAACPA